MPAETTTRCGRFNERESRCSLPAGHDGDCLFLWAGVGRHISEGGVLTPYERGDVRAAGWTPDGPHGATCEGGPLDRDTVLVYQRDHDAESLTVRGDASGAYEWYWRASVMSPRGALAGEGTRIHTLRWSARRATPTGERTA